MSTVKSRNLQGEPGALPDPAVSNRLPASRAVFMGCFHWLGTQTAWCPSPGLPDPSPSPHTGLLGHGEEADRAHHFHRYTRSHKHREDGLCSLAIQEGKQCPMGGGGEEVQTAVRWRDQELSLNTKSHLPGWQEAKGPQAEDDQGGESPGIGAGRALLLH